ncbi:MAG TPA: hypothetical protein DIS79_00400 [Bacteroidetes bacterium]|nr:hypothetical protein [Bacteroidota bacterium]HRK05782.1 hypothetical protein [Chlorobiota bacterium]
MIKSILSIIVVVCTLPTILTGQDLQSQQNIEGFVKDQSGKHVGCKIYIFTPSGKKLQISSAEKDGSYLQTLAEAGPHKFVFQDYNIYRKEETVDIPKSAKFKIIKRDFAVQSVVEGTTLMSSRAWIKNATMLTPEGEAKIKEVMDLLAANQQMRVVFTVRPDEDQVAGVRAKNEAEYNKAMAAWEKAKKKVKKGATPPEPPVRGADPADPNVELVRERVAALKKLLKDVRNGDERITYDTEPLPALTTASPEPVAQPEEAAATTKKGKKAKKAAPAKKTSAPAAPVYTHATLEAKIGKVKKLFP